MSLHIRVQELQQEEYNPVLFYKTQFSKDESEHSLPDDSFVLMIQTESQRENAQRYSSLVIIDDTHNVSEYDFKLMSIMGIDEKGHGMFLSCPEDSLLKWSVGVVIAWMITSSMKAAFVESFFREVKKREPRFKPEVRSQYD